VEQINQLAIASQRSPTQMVTYLVLLGLHVYQRNRLNPEADTELNKTRKKCNGISFMYPLILLKSSSPFKIQRSLQYFN